MNSKFIKPAAPDMLTLEPHPYADLLPRMSDSEFEELKADVLAHGLAVPVMLFDGKILDGRHRHRACVETGAAFRTEIFEGDDAAALAFVVSHNLKRRHLNESQRALVAAELATLTKGGDRSANVHSATPTADEAAKKLNVSRRSVMSAKALKKEAPPEVVEQVRAGKKSVSGALKEVRDSGDTPRKPGRPRKTEAPAEAQAPHTPFPVMENPAMVASVVETAMVPGAGPVVRYLLLKPIEGDAVVHVMTASVFATRFSSDENDKLKAGEIVDKSDGRFADMLAVTAMVM